MPAHPQSAIMAAEYRAVGVGVDLFFIELHETLLRGSAVERASRR